jgi:hypothetical protein
VAVHSGLTSAPRASELEALSAVRKLLYVATGEWSFQLPDSLRARVCP